MMVNKSAGTIIGLSSAVLSLIALILYICNGISNVGVVIGLIIVIVAYVLYAFVTVRYIEILPLLATVFITFSLGEYTVDSIANFMDYFNGITMFQSGGSIQVIFAIIGIIASSLILSVIANFMKRAN